MKMHDGFELLLGPSHSNEYCRGSRAIHLYSCARYKLLHTGKPSWMLPSPTYHVPVLGIWPEPTNASHLYPCPSTEPHQLIALLIAITSETRAPFACQHVLSRCEELNKSAKRCPAQMPRSVCKSACTVCRCLSKCLLPGPIMFRAFDTTLVSQMLPMSSDHHDHARFEHLVCNWIFVPEDASWSDDFWFPATSVQEGP